MPSLLACCCISDPSKCMCQCYMLQGLQACTPNAHATKTAPFHTRQAPLAKSTCTSSSAAAFSFAMKSFEETTTPYSTCTIQMQKVPLASQHPVRRTNHCKQSTKNTKHTNNRQISAQECIQLVPACGMPAACPSNRPKAQTTPMFLQCFYGALTSCTNIRIFSYMAAESVSFSTKIFKHSCRLDASDRPANQQLSPKYANQAPSFTSFSLRRSSDNPCTWMHQTAPPTSS